MMNSCSQSPLNNYNSLTDKHLFHYFNKDRMRKHLVNSGLITPQGEVISDGVYRMQIARREHRIKIRDMIAKTIVEKALEMERSRQITIRKKIEEIAKIELVKRVKADCNRIGDEDFVSYFNPGDMSVKSKSNKQNRRPSSSELDEFHLPTTPEEDSRIRLRQSFPHEDIQTKHLSQLDALALDECARIIKSQEKYRINKMPYLGMGRELLGRRPKKLKSLKKKKKRKSNVEIIEDDTNEMNQLSYTPAISSQGEGNPDNLNFDDDVDDKSEDQSNKPIIMFESLDPINNVDEEEELVQNTDGIDIIVDSNDLSPENNINDKENSIIDKENSIKNKENSIKDKENSIKDDENSIKDKKNSIRSKENRDNKNKMFCCDKKETDTQDLNVKDDKQSSELHGNKPYSKLQGNDKPGIVDNDETLTKDNLNDDADVENTLNKDLNSIDKVHKSNSIKQSNNWFCKPNKVEEKVTLENDYYSTTSEDIPNEMSTSTSRKMKNHKSKCKPLKQSSFKSNQKTKKKDYKRFSDISEKDSKSINKNEAHCNNTSEHRNILTEDTTDFTSKSKSIVKSEEEYTTKNLNKPPIYKKTISKNSVFDNLFNMCNAKESNSLMVSESVISSEKNSPKQNTRRESNLRINIEEVKPLITEPKSNLNYSISKDNLSTEKIDAFQVQKLTNEKVRKTSRKLSKKSGRSNSIKSNDSTRKKKLLKHRVSDVDDTDPFQQYDLITPSTDDDISNSINTVKSCKTASEKKSSIVKTCFRTNTLESISCDKLDQLDKNENESKKNLNSESTKTFDTDTRNILQKLMSKNNSNICQFVPNDFSNRKERKVHKRNKQKKTNLMRINNNNKGKFQTLATVSFLFHAPMTSRRYHISVDQQPCGGNSLNVFRGDLIDQSVFNFVSKRHKGYPFSLTFYIDDVKDCRISTCCEYKHKQGKRIGGPNGHFTYYGIEGDYPCYICLADNDLRKKKDKKSLVKIIHTLPKSQSASLSMVSINKWISENYNNYLMESYDQNETNSDFVDKSKYLCYDNLKKSFINIPTLQNSNINNSNSIRYDALPPIKINMPRVEFTSKVSDDLINYIEYMSSDNNEETYETNENKIIYRT